MTPLLNNYDIYDKINIYKDGNIHKQRGCLKKKTESQKERDNKISKNQNEQIKKLSDRADVQ